jgi:hypothetical protein
MDTRGHDPEVRLQVEDLIGSLDDTLPDERVLQELEALKACGPTDSCRFSNSCRLNSGRELPRLFPSLGSRQNRF